MLENGGTRETGDDSVSDRRQGASTPGHSDAAEGAALAGGPEQRIQPSDEDPSSPKFDFALLADLDADPGRRRREWRRFYEYYDPRLRFHCESVRRYRDANDIVAHIWVKVFFNVRDMGEKSSEELWGWMLEVGRNNFRDRVKMDGRRMARNRKWLDDPTSHSDGDSFTYFCESLSLDTDYEWPITEAELLRVLSSLKKSDQEFLKLLIWEGKSHKEVAEQLGLASVEASRARRLWILKRIRRELGLL